jgi:hypothetical protein
MKLAWVLNQTVTFEELHQSSCVRGSQGMKLASLLKIAVTASQSDGSDGSDQAIKRTGTAGTAPTNRPGRPLLLSAMIAQADWFRPPYLVSFVAENVPLEIPVGALVAQVNVPALRPFDRATSLSI